MPEGSGRAGLLAQLVENHLDPGYATAAARRAERGGGPRWYDRPTTALACVLIGFLLVVAYVHTNRAAPAAATVHSDLVTRVRTAQKDGDALERTVQSLSAQVVSSRNAALGSLSATLQAAEIEAGATAVTGPGVQIMLSEPAGPVDTPTPGRVGTIAQPATHILLDRDIRSVVNELWADGAEAIAVNGIRLTATSAVRFAGQAILVDFQPIASPYVVAAIGNADTLVTRFTDSAVADRYQTYVGAEGIGFAITQKSSLTLTASPAATLRYARAGQ